MADLYVFLSRLSSALMEPVSALAWQVNFPLLSALLLGLLGATAPCQLSANASALAYIARRVTDPRHAVQGALAFTLGKVVTYTVLGAVVILLGVKLSAATSVPFIAAVRKTLGPLLLVVGLYMLGLLPLRTTVGIRWSGWLEERFAHRGTAGAFLLGLVFSLGFCPTMFWLFFGLLVPLGLSVTGGAALPAVFAVGTSIPVLAMVAVFAVGTSQLGPYLTRMKRLDVYLARIAGSVFILVGAMDTLVYWTL